AIYLEEYAPENWFTRALQMNISNLAAVPSVVYGILGLAVFVRFMALGHSVLAGALTLSLLIVPVTIIAAQEAIRAVPPSLRHASYGIG
ncbi:MAG: ABC transporter permease subunit, partial [Gemmatimonadota bacterium]